MLYRAYFLLKLCFFSLSRQPETTHLKVTGNLSTEHLALNFYRLWRVGSMPIAAISGHLAGK